MAKAMKECRDKPDEEITDIVFLSGNPNVEITEDINDQPKMLCLLSVPAHLQLRDIFMFIDGMRQDIEEVKIVRDGTPNKFMVFLNFFSSMKAREFYEIYNETKYNNLESDVCQIAYISHVEAGAFFPANELTELPSCSVCLERLDEPLQGVITTILCNHAFHDQCLSQMSQTTCPVCRYVQSPEMVGDSACFVCDLRENLWICLICGHVGCGRYGKKHAYHHFTETGHTFALEIGRNLVWDYVDDAYVHRLAVNQSDGKLVQVGTSSETGDKKLDSMNMEFSAVLTSQLESQRFYFESQLESLAISCDQKMTLALSEAQNATEKCKKYESKLNSLMKEHASLQKKLDQATNLATKFQKDLSEEKALTTSLLSSQKGWQDKAEVAEKALAEVQEEVRDLMMNFQMKEKMSEMLKDEEIDLAELEKSEISLKPSTSSKHRSNRRKRK